MTHIPVFEFLFRFHHRVGKGYWLEWCLQNCICQRAEKQLSHHGWMKLIIDSLMLNSLQIILKDIPLSRLIKRPHTRWIKKFTKFGWNLNEILLSSQKSMTASIRLNENHFQCLHIITITKLIITTGSSEWTMTRFCNGTTWTSFWNGIIILC